MTREVSKSQLVTAVAVVALCTAVAGCGSGSASEVPRGGFPSAGELARGGAPLPRVTFNGCVVPAGQPTWANILVTGGKGPFRAVWSIDGKVDSTDPQRTIAVPGKGTRLELFVTLSRVGQTFQIQVFDALGSAGVYSFANAAPGDIRCDYNGQSPRANR